MTAKHMLAVGSVIAFLLGAFMIFATRQFLEPLGLASDPKVGLHVLLGLGYAYFLMRQPRVVSRTNPA